MAVYLITYSLKNQDKDYGVLFKEIESIGNAIKPFDNTWFVSSKTEDAFQINDRLVPNIELTDGIIVVEVSTGVAGNHKHGKLTAEWILDQLR